MDMLRQDPPKGARYVLEKIYEDENSVSMYGLHVFKTRGGNADGAGIRDCR